MSRTNIKSFQRVTVPTSISVLLPAKFEESEGVTWTKQGDRLHGEQVRVLQSRELRSKEQLAKIAGENPGWIDFLCGVKDLQHLRSRKYDPLVYERAWSEIAPTVAHDPKSAAPEQLGSYLLVTLAIALDGVRVIFWKTKPDRSGNQRMLPGLYCPDLKTAVAARWLLAPELRICAECAKIFTAARPKQLACSLRCRETHRIKRFRARKQLKATA